MDSQSNKEKTNPTDESRHNNSTFLSDSLLGCIALLIVIPLFPLVMDMIPDAEWVLHLDRCLEFLASWLIVNIFLHIFSVIIYVIIIIFIVMLTIGSVSEIGPNFKDLGEDYYIVINKAWKICSSSDSTDIDSTDIDSTDIILYDTISNDIDSDDDILYDTISNDIDSDDIDSSTINKSNTFPLQIEELLKRINQQ